MGEGNKRDRIGKPDREAGRTVGDGRCRQLCNGVLYSRKKDPDNRAKGNLVDTA